MTHRITTRSGAFPPPLRGRAREGGKPRIPAFGATPLPNPPPQGGREQAERGETA
jgi:hypothetical protein